MKSDIFYPLALSNISDGEVDKACDQLRSRMTTMGKNVSNFENNFSSFVGTEYSLMVNSGSSANLLIAYSLKLYLELSQDKRRHIIIPAIGWSTTYAPFIQAGFEISIVDVDINTYNIDLNEAEKARRSDTVAIIAVNILGCPSQLTELQGLCNKNAIYLIEDNCESMGAEINNKKAGSFGIMSSHSFFFSHHINTMEGGMVSTANKDMYVILNLLRNHGWARNIETLKTLIKDRSNKVALELKNIFISAEAIEDYDFIKDFLFIFPAFNLRPTEIQGVLGISQLKRFSDFLRNRIDNQSHFYKLLENQSDQLKLQGKNGKSSSFGFGLITKTNQMRRYLVEDLRKNGCQCRPIVSGNIARHPIGKYMDCSNQLKNSDIVHNRGLFIGNHPTEMKNELTQVADIIINTLKKY